MRLMCGNFSCLETVLKIIVFLQKGGVIDDDLCVCDPQFQNFIVYNFRSLDRSYGLFKVDIERPEFERFEQASLRGERL
jgi:hypothetical protein